MVSQLFPHLENMMVRTKEAIHEFMQIITPEIEEAKDEHQRLYWHHIYEEEEHRLDRIHALLPKLSEASSSASFSEGEFIRLLQDISLEKFGLHNFLEHLDLSLFQFKDTQHEEKIQSMRDMTAEDYQQIKQIVETLNEKYDGADLSAGTPTDEKEGVPEGLKVELYTKGHSTSIDPKKDKSNTSKHLTIGSLKSK